mmetsp:Transcript_49129/g.107030  ORF Transcript_49129/g.107030 Transcript_49129/m.107030 type:complete len:967 (-) Transcript_49129:221-3121(-)
MLVQNEFDLDSHQFRLGTLRAEVEALSGFEHGEPEQQCSQVDVESWAVVVQHEEQQMAEADSARSTAAATLRQKATERDEAKRQWLNAVQSTSRHQQKLQRQEAELVQRLDGVAKRKEVALSQRKVTIEKCRQKIRTVKLHISQLQRQRRQIRNDMQFGKGDIAEFAEDARASMLVAERQHLSAKSVDAEMRLTASNDRLAELKQLLRDAEEQRANLAASKEELERQLAVQDPGFIAEESSPGVVVVPDGESKLAAQGDLAEIEGQLKQAQGRLRQAKATYNSAVEQLRTEEAERRLELDDRSAAIVKLKEYCRQRAIVDAKRAMCQPSVEEEVEDGILREQIEGVQRALDALESEWRTRRQILQSSIHEINADLESKTALIGRILDQSRHPAESVDGQLLEAELFHQRSLFQLRQEQCVCLQQRLAETQTQFEDRRSVVLEWLESQRHVLQSEPVHDRADTDLDIAEVTAMHEDFVRYREQSWASWQQKKEQLQCTVSAREAEYTSAQTELTAMQRLHKECLAKVKAALTHEMHSVSQSTQKEQGRQVAARAVFDQEVAQCLRDMRSRAQKRNQRAPTRAEAQKFVEDRQRQHRQFLENLHQQLHEKCRQLGSAASFVEERKQELAAAQEEADRASATWEALQVQASELQANTDDKQVALDAVPGLSRQLKQLESKLAQRQVDLAQAVEEETSVNQALEQELRVLDEEMASLQEQQCGLAVALKDAVERGKKKSTALEADVRSLDEHVQRLTGSLRTAEEVFSSCQQRMDQARKRLVQVPVDLRAPAGAELPVGGPRSRQPGSARKAQIKSVASVSRAFPGDKELCIFYPKVYPLLVGVAVVRRPRGVSGQQKRTLRIASDWSRLEWYVEGKTVPDFFIKVDHLEGFRVPQSTVDAAHKACLDGSSPSHLLEVELFRADKIAEPVWVGVERIADYHLLSTGIQALLDFRHSLLRLRGVLLQGSKA